MNDGALLAYARAMRSAERLEGRLKILFGLHNLDSGISKDPGPLTDEKFEEHSSHPEPPGNSIGDGLVRAQRMGPDARLEFRGSGEAPSPGVGPGAGLQVSISVPPGSRRRPACLGRHPFRSGFPPSPRLDI